MPKTLGPKDTNKVAVMECLVCEVKYSVHDVLTYNYFMDNHICYKCCIQMQVQPYSVSCFGKYTADKKQKQFGYDKKALECSDVCPDRLVCPLFASGEVEVRRELTDEARQTALELVQAKPNEKPRGVGPFRKGSVIGDAFNFFMQGVNEKQVDRFVAKLGCDKRWLLAQMRKGRRNGHKWDWSEDVRGGKYKIGFPKADTKRKRD